MFERLSIYIELIRYKQWMSNLVQLNLFKND